MGVAGRFFAQLFGTTLCDFGAVMRWWLAVCSGSSSAFGYLLPSLARGFLSRVYPFARYPVASTPARLPPAPPFRGERAGGSWAVEIGVCSDARSGIWQEVVGGTAWLQFWGAAEIYLPASRAVRHCGGHGQVSLASPWGQEVCRRCIRRTVCLQSGLPTPRGCD